MQYNYKAICKKVLGALPQRQKKIIERRFGLGRAGQIETLQAIGDDFSITRERIRQIQNDAFLRLKEEEEQDRELRKALFYFKGYLQKQGGLKREDILLASIGGKQKQEKEVQFLLTLGSPFSRHPETDELYPFWALDKSLFARVGEIVRKLVVQFKSIGEPLPQERVLSFIPESPLPVSLAALEIARLIEKGPLGKYGLIVWPVVNPKGARDKAYLALKKAGRPLHFREIARIANTLESPILDQSRNFRQTIGLGPKGWNKREVIAETVHNELIRDPRFVLLGRGIYGLKEWGHKEGNVKDVIAEILKEAERPLSKEEIITRVLKERFVKRATVLVSLKDKNLFLREPGDQYILKSQLS